MSNTIRLDALLAARRLAATRTQAADLIRRGGVRVNGVALTKPGRRVPRNAALEVDDSVQPFVSRGGLKLVAALDHFAIDATDVRALDLGASTGGFTDVLLQRGAAHVTALDAGHSQLHKSLRHHPRVLNLENLNGRYLEPEDLPGTIDLIVCDVSFISLKLVLPPALELAAPGAKMIALIKPQFEAGRQWIGKGGIVRDEAVHQHVCRDITHWLAAQPGWSVQGLISSPIIRQDGNAEFLVAACKGLS